MIEIIIDGKKIQAQPGMTVLEAALENGIDIPHLCYHPELSISGGCRLCIVKVNDGLNPIASCGLACQDGMTIQTRDEELTALRRDIIDLFISDHPLDCVTCDKSGSCLLQKYAYEFGISETSYDLEISKELFQDDNPIFIRDHQYCILCGRCVRVCDEITGVHAIDFANRGFESSIATPFDGPMIDSSCVFCGNCVQVCPTAALMPAARMNRGREWELDRVNTICAYCGVGCEIEYALKDGEILYAQSTPEATVNGEFLCAKGRYGWDYVNNPDRLVSPLIRKDLAHELGMTDEGWEIPEDSPLSIRKPKIGDNYVPVDWDTAIEVVADRLADTVKKHGPDSIMGLASARCTNEENYLYQKFMRAAIGTNNIDHCARL